jgi:hypothetical protein
MTTRRVNRLDELAQSVPPPRDLWPAIERAIESETAAAGETDRAAATGTAPLRRRAWTPALGMAAAVALVAIGVIIGRQLHQPITVVAGTPTTQPAANVISAALQRDQKYRAQRDALIVEVQDRLQAMPEAERAKVAASLATLRRSIGEIEAALGRDPANALLQELLVNSCQEEMRALTAVRDSAGQET